MRHVETRHSDEPLTETVFLILSSISTVPRHGYAIMQDVEAMTDGRVRLSTGTVYGALRRLLEAGLIRRFREHEPSRDRHTYEMTTAGRQVIVAELERMKSLTRIASRRLAEVGL